MTDQTITRQDLQSLKTEIVDDISSVLADAMTNISINFQDLKYDFQDLKTDFQGMTTDFHSLREDFKEVQVIQNRMEQKLDPTIQRVDELSVRVTWLEQKAV